MFREDKATAMAVYFLEKEPAHFMNDVKLMKLLYIAERRAAQLHGVPITQDSYSSMIHGPVLLGTYGRMGGKGKAGPWAEHLSIVGAHSGDQYRINLLKGMNPEDVLRLSEIEILEDVWVKFGSWTWQQLKKYCHDYYKEYDKRAESPGENDPRSIPFTLKDIFLALGDSEEVAQEKFENVLLYG